MAKSRLAMIRLHYSSQAFFLAAGLCHQRVRLKQGPRIPSLIRL